MEVPAMRPESHAAVAPPRWALSPWARAVRRTAWWWEVTRHVEHFCSPLTIQGAEHLLSAPKPLIVIPNHASHFDTGVVYHAIPPPLRWRTAIAAAADRFYRVWWKGARFSLLLNAFPIERGGGRRALDYAGELLEHGWSLIVYPEGHRSRNGEVQPFHHGVSILALEHRVPVVPMYVHGTREILPPGVRHAVTPGPVTVAIGEPVLLEPGLSVPEGTARLEASLRLLAEPFVPQELPVEAAEPVDVRTPVPASR
jgi:1-acyl-sn-glycerol-3-phosphate acyltransferase